MSNRNLGIAIALVILLALAVWGGIRIFNSSETTEQPTQATQTNSPTNNSSNNSTNSTGVTDNMTDNNQCIRDFDATKLQQPINIKNQFVTLDVKDFGTIKLQLYDQDAPKAVESFLKLVNSGYYNCLTFHRVLKGFVIQGGDPNGTGTGGQSAFGKPFEDELNPNTPSFKTGYVKGVLAMANSGPNTNGSQFFINLVDNNNNLGKLYTIFGKVVAGLDVVDKIGQVPVSGAGSGMPLSPVVISKAVISK